MQTVSRVWITRILHKMQITTSDENTGTITVR
jgi:hypothetical protein